MMLLLFSGTHHGCLEEIMRNYVQRKKANSLRGMELR